MPPVVPAAPPGPMPRPTRPLTLLATLFALSGIAGTIVVSTASVVGLAMAPREGLATLPVALALLGGMAITYPASRIMARWGRRTGFVVGTLVAAAGAAICSVAIFLHDFTLFCAGSFLLGGLGGVASYYRFAAMELVEPSRRARAVSAVLLGGIFAGFVGPPAGAAAADLLAGGRFAGSYVLMVLLDVLILCLLPFARLSGPAPPVPKIHKRSLRAIGSDRRFLAAVLASTVAFGAMVLTMVSTPLSLSHIGHPGATAWVIQAHVVAMYVPALFSGRLVERMGTGRMMAAGLLGIGACVAVNLAGSVVGNHWVALVLLGFGWNLLFVAGTTHLSQAHGETDKAAVQGLNDLLVSSVAAASALSAGIVFNAVGWRGLNMLVGAVVLLAGLVLAVLLRAGGRPVAGAAIRSIASESGESDSPKRLINP